MLKLRLPGLRLATHLCLTVANLWQPFRLIHKYRYMLYCLLAGTHNSETTLYPLSCDLNDLILFKLYYQHKDPSDRHICDIIA